MGLYGYYRGYNNLYNSSNFNIREPLMTDRIVNGFTSFLLNLNPVLQPFFLYGIVRRLEKRYKNLPIIKEDYLY